jgi:acetyltransferase-like isoleucine patch superfamily enzyme
MFHKYLYPFLFCSYGKNIRYGEHGSFLCIPNSVKFRTIRKISIGNDVRIGNGVFIHSHHNGGGIIIHDRVRINECSHIEAYSKVIIEQSVLIAPYVLISSSNHCSSNPSIPISEQGSIATGDIVIERGAWLGKNCIVLGGVTVGYHSIVGSNAVLTKTINSRVVAVGNPAKTIKAM